LPTTQRYKLTIAYRGTNYHGWQSQPLTETYTGVAPPRGQGVPTIQETVERVFAGVVNHPVILSGSSRTDKGVHAKGQVAHFDTDKIQIPREGMRRAVNHRLPPDIIVRKIEPVPDTFDAVRSTVRKRYQYTIWNHPERPIFFHDLAWHRWFQLDIDAMRAAAQHFVGELDFASFARPGHGKLHTVRTVYGCDVTQRGPRIVIGVEGRGFLWNMIRIMVGTLVHIGIGRHKPDDIKEMLAARDREAAGPTAPAVGLFLQWIRFKPLENADGTPYVAPPDPPSLRGGKPTMHPGLKIPEAPPGPSDTNRDDDLFETTDDHDVPEEE
jgi:tRNA pseudouridine38-40 synthase